MQRRLRHGIGLDQIILQNVQKIAYLTIIQRTSSEILYMGLTTCKNPPTADKGGLQPPHRAKYHRIHPIQAYPNLYLETAESDAMQQHIHSSKIIGRRGLLLSVYIFHLTDTCGTEQSRTTTASMVNKHYANGLQPPKVSHALSVAGLHSQIIHLYFYTWFDAVN